MSLPKGLPLAQTQDTWATQLDPVIKNQIVNGLLIKNVKLINGVTVVNHLLARQMVGWYLVDIDAATTVHRSQPLNDKTLTLTSTAVATANIWVF